ncbi:hypothetical protein SVI_2907 [Shewanella violacea DSS12]|uniref:Uncharacterized protein n=1 Tax=Shewanella violacea (strain JCM 10179 / CIP 106290 / LMG 19151 / DSS12) TaxID=637905 RepID=D4ZMH9_SHEVD|nr:hypothetical protein SVI_2907 [Shewanella violacea DSS12]
MVENSYRVWLVPILFLRIKSYYLYDLVICFIAALARFRYL